MPNGRLQFTDAKAWGQRSEVYKMKFDYIKEVMRTASGEFHGGKVGAVLFENRANVCVGYSEALDSVKKTLFYGKADPHSCLHYTSDLPMSDSKFAVFNTDILHGIIGAHTETGELLKALLEGANLQILDYVNIKEEVGDVLWYLALIANACGFTLEDAMQTNIAKLRKRYPEKFTEDDAINRDVDAEREALEGSETYGIAQRLTPEEADALIKEANNEKF